MNEKTDHLETLAIHAGQPAEPVTGAVTPPVFMTSTYAQEGPGGHKGFEYSRTHNPTRQALEANLAALEGARFGVAFASGCAATTTVMHLLSTGDEVVAADDLYGGTYRIGLAVNQGRIEAAIDGSVLFTVDDHERPLDGGAVGLVVEEGRVMCDAVSIQAG